MAILSERKTWTKPKPANASRRSSDLTPEEQGHVRVALRFLAKRHGSWVKLARAMDAHLDTVKLASRKSVSAGIALRVARVASVPLEDLLAGRFPVAGACPWCGCSSQK